MLIIVVLVKVNKVKLETAYLSESRHHLPHHFNGEMSYDKKKNNNLFMHSSKAVAAPQGLRTGGVFRAQVCGREQRQIK